MGNWMIPLQKRANEITADEVEKILFGGRKDLLDILYDAICSGDIKTILLLVAGVLIIAGLCAYGIYHMVTSLIEHNYRVRDKEIQPWSFGYTCATAVAILLTVINLILGVDGELIPIVLLIVPYPFMFFQYINIE